MTEDKKKNEPGITFRQLHTHVSYGEALYSIYYVVEGGKSKVIDVFKDLDVNTRDEIKDLISKMATVKDFKSPKVQYKLNDYPYGEIKPRPHRFFFFQKLGNNYIFFEYRLKKKDSLGDDIYKQIDRKREIYEREFEEFIRRRR